MGAWSDPTHATVRPVLFGGFSGMEGARSDLNRVVVRPRWREATRTVLLSVRDGMKPLRV
jgi:hypothetical protein